MAGPKQFQPRRMGERRGLTSFYRSRSARVKLASLVLLLTGLVNSSAAEPLGDARRLEELLGRLTVAFEAGKADSVLTVLDSTGRGQQLTARLWNLRGLCLASMGRSREAIDSYVRGISIAPSRAELHVNLAVTLLSTGASGRALAEFEEGVRLDPESVDAHLGYGRLLTRFRRWKMAEEALDRAVVLASDDTRVRTALAEFFEARGDTVQAFQAWEWTEVHSPDAETARRLANLSRTARPSEAIEWYERCLERDDRALDCRESAAQLRLSAGDLEGARQLLESHAEELSDAGFHNLCLTLQGLEDATAIEALLGRRSPALGATWGVVAAAYRSAGRLEAALGLARRAREQAPADNALANMEAVILYDLGRKDEARRRWEEILATDPDDASARQNLEQLY